MLRVCLSVIALAASLSVHAFAQGAAPGLDPKVVKPIVIVNLNTATVAELEVLPGVGAKTAERIIDYRQKKGPFKKIEENPEVLTRSSFLTE